MINKKRFTEQEYQWVLRVIKHDYYDSEEDEQYEEDVFATEEEAQSRLKELYEKALEDYDIDRSSFDVNRAEYADVDGSVRMYIKKEKTNYLDMTVGEFYNKVSFIYGDKQGLTSSAEAYETSGFLHDLTKEDWIYNSPYLSFKFQVYYYSPHPDDVIYKIIGDGFGDILDFGGMSLSRDTKMSEVLQDIKNEDDEYYATFLSNVRKITDNGGEYLLDRERQKLEYYYIYKQNKDEFCIDSIGNNKVRITAKVKE